MDKPKLTEEQLKNYLGTGLKVYKSKEKGVNWKGGKSILTAEYLCHMIAYPNSKFVLECYRLSDLDKFIPELGFVPLRELGELEKGYSDFLTIERDRIIKKRGYDFWITDIPFGIMQKLFQWHFWPFGDEYFDEGLIIDKLKQS